MTRAIRKGLLFTIFTAGGLFAAGSLVQTANAAPKAYHDLEWVGYDCEPTGCDPAAPEGGICCHDN